jgi:thiol-disulfide isomerase/thioredoxin
MDNKKQLLISPAKVSVLVMISPECPLCQSYSRTLNLLYNKYKSQDVKFYGVVPGKTFEKEAVQQYIEQYRIAFPVWFDPNLIFTRNVGASKTPEVFVYNNKFELQYSGRIDNWAFEPGKKRKVITEHNLDETLQSLLAGKMIKIKRTEAIGCYIED